jgi:hypothetical protein
VVIQPSNECRCLLGNPGCNYVDFEIISQNQLGLST